MVLRDTCAYAGTGKCTCEFIITVILYVSSSLTHLARVVTLARIYYNVKKDLPVPTAAVIGTDFTYEY